MNYALNICELIGRTPMVKLNDTVADLPPLVLAKLEFMNPCGSIKDRMAQHMINQAEEKGLLKASDTVVDNTSGNTGASAAMVCAARGHSSLFTTPEKTSKEKVDLIKSFGAEVIVTPSDLPWDDPSSCYMQAKRIGEKPGYFWMNQYHSSVNVEAHYKTTGPEIWEDTEGRVTHFVCGVGTGGTISGTSKYLKEKNPKIKTLGVDPVGSLFAAYMKDSPLPEPQPYKVEGIGTDVITEAFIKEYVDEVVQVTDRDAFQMSRELCRREGVSTGGSSGACLWAIREHFKDLSEEDVVVTIFADGGIRYLSKMYNDQWMKENGLMSAQDIKGEKSP